MNFKKELNIAKNASMLAAKLLVDKKSLLNSSIFSNNRDIKLSADIAAEKIIKNEIKNYSSFPILAEESGKSKDNLGEIYWVVDPLDGTANYSRNIPICCISIALLKNLKPIVGVIYDFNNDELYEGSKYTQALLNKTVISVSTVKNKHEGIMLTGLPNKTDYSDEALLKMVKDFQAWRKVRMIGSAAMASVYIASGKADLYSEKKTFLWDVAAGAAIVEAAGGKALITNLNDKFQVDVLFSNAHIK